MLHEIGRVVDGRLTGQHVRGRHPEEEPQRPAGEGHGGEHGPSGGAAERPKGRADAKQPQTERGDEPERGPGEERDPLERRQAECLARHPREIQGGEDDLDRLATLAECEDRGGEGAGRSHEEQGPTGGMRREHEGDGQPEHQVGAEKDLEEGHG